MRLDVLKSVKLTIGVVDREHMQAFHALNHYQTFSLAFIVDGPEDMIVTITKTIIYVQGRGDS